MMGICAPRAHSLPSILPDPSLLLCDPGGIVFEPIDTGGVTKVQGEFFVIRII